MTEIGKGAFVGCEGLTIHAPAFDNLQNMIGLTDAKAVIQKALS